ncbi:phage tail sheath-like protein [Lachnoanaerobaculum saburreum F0468]|uniref:Phage tail sheath-like protein n=1 Tax=Lachnoanaerobaculum saburreum F0468 TaxID=1095750 RepID=I0R7R5_9FIRM|nr:phage tail sheath C-terminal domain-containing protein [Lachnoanaerobaculum saburreum]EIC95723.1 phage tail sheath-like protein [Lachnoanaerobaculum saburreum F0468]
MSKLTSPSITITFTEQGASAVTRGERGIVALVLKGTRQQTFKVMSISDIPTGVLSAENEQFVKDALIGYSHAPKYIIVYVMPTAEDMTKAYKDMMQYFENEKFTYMAIPTAKTDNKVQDVVTWAKKQRDEHNLVKVVLPEITADSEGIINWCSTLYRTKEQAITPEQGCARIAGLLAGTGLTVSGTYAPLQDFVDVSRLTKIEQDEAVGAGKLIALWDGEKVKLNRAVTSLTTISADKGDSFKKIKLVETMDMMEDDIRKTIEDSYIGKFSNSYDNKCLLITAINAYFMGLVNDGLLDIGQCQIDIEGQKQWLKAQGKKVILEDGSEKDIDDCSDMEIKRANTGSHVFLKAVVSLVDAIEDVSLKIKV